MQTSFIRKIHMRGTSLGISLPPEIRREMNLRNADFVQIISRGGGMCEIIKADLAHVPDRVANAAKPLPTIHG